MRLVTHYIRNLPISKKTTLLISLIIICTALLGNTIFYLAAHYYTKTYVAPNIMQSLSNIMDIDGIDQALIQSPATSELFFEEMGRYKQFDTAILFGHDHSVVTTYPAALEVPPHLLNRTQFSENLSSNEFVYELEDATGQYIGSIYLRLSAFLTPTLLKATLIGGSIFTLISLSFIFFFQFIISKELIRPILSLQNTICQVREDQTFEVKAKTFADDEVGKLVSDFNRLLDLIVERDAALTTAKDNAEQERRRAEKMNEGTVKANKRLEMEVRVRTQIEKKLTDFQSYLNNILNSMPSILIAVDGECTVTQWNKEATALTSTRAAEAIDEPLATVFPLLVPYVPVILRSIHENIIQKDEIRHQVGDHIHMYEIVIYPLLGSGHQGAVIRIDEITEKRRLEEMIVQSEKMMSIGGLAAGMAHEINNPLGAIIQSSQTVQRRLSQELPKNQEVAEALGTNIQTIHQYLEEREIFKFLENIHDGGSRAAKIVTNMLQFSRKSNKTLVPCDLNEVIKRAIEIAQNDYTLSRTGEANTIRLYTRFAEGLEAVPCVSTEIEQVVLNLIKNAAYTIEDKIKDPVLASNWHPQINVETYKEKDFALVRVKDNGLGMSEKVRKHIFEPFFTTKDVGKGTGLGLSVSYFIINSNHKGTMEAHSMKDKGSTFLIRIPLTQASQNSLT